MTTFERIIETLKKDPFFDDYIFTKGDGALTQKYDWGWKKISFNRVSRFYSLYLDVSFGIRFNIVEKFSGIFDYRNASDRRYDSTVGYASQSLGMPIYFDFEFDLSNYESEFKLVKKCIKKGVEDVLWKYNSLDDVFKLNILPIIQTHKCPNFHGSRWMYKYLYICKITHPDEYARFKEIILERIEYIKKHFDPKAISNWFTRLDEVLAYIESIDIDKH